MIEKIIEYYNEIPKKKYFLLKVAVSTRKKQRKLVHAIAIPTDTQIEGLKEYIYNNFEYKEFLIKSEDFLNLISKHQEIIEIDGFKIPYTENPQVDEHFIPTAEDFYNLSKPYELFRIRVGGESYAYGPLSHPEHPNYSSFYPFIREHMGYDIRSGGPVDFCVLFPVEKAHMENLKITRSKIKFDVVGDLNNLNCTYYLKIEKEERTDKFDPKKNNAIEYRGRIKEIELTLWHSKKKLDYVRTRHVDSKKLSKDSYWSKSNVWPTDNGDKKEDKKSRQKESITEVQINNIVTKASERAGIKCPNPNRKHVHPHMFRHTFVRYARKMGMDYVAIQEIVGHSDISTTMGMYGKPTWDDKVAEARKMKDFGRKI